MKTVPESDRLPISSPAFPWLSSIVGVALIGWLLLLLDPALQGFYRALPEAPKSIAEILGPLGLASLYALCLLWDGNRYWRTRQRLHENYRQLADENRDLWKYRHQLRIKARTHADHADKLKRFISNKLLDYIEYDEKFLHFQSIAAEVRHNGVIAFDTVQSALAEAVAQSRPQAESQSTMQSDKPHGKPTSNQKSDPMDLESPYHRAQSQMRYLWDLLDLATTDNLALHIAGYQSRCEELYYQQELNPNDPEASQADYEPQLAVWHAVRPLLDETTDQLALKAQLNKQDNRLQLDIDPNIRLSLTPTDTLLGKANHLTLLLDNLLKNAQFYSRQRPYRHRHQRVAVALDQSADKVRLRVHNRGPHIAAEDSDRIFQLGYSTRRVREHHGKGLGLFFVQEIVRGYEGSIAVHNTDNRVQHWQWRLTTTDDKTSEFSLRIVLDKGRPRIAVKDSEEAIEQLEKQHSWSLRRSLKSLAFREEGEKGSGDWQTLALEETATDSPQLLFDPTDSHLPRWVVEIHPRKRGARIVFEPLDLRGVEFTVCLPTARARLEGQDNLALTDIDDEVAQLDESFAEFSEFAHKSPG